MNKLTVALAFAFALTFGMVGAAHARDVLFVVLEESDGNKSMHHQMTPDCRWLLKKYRQAKEAGEVFTLTFEAPPKVTGKVLSLSCILPDGTIEGDGADMPRGLRSYDDGKHQRRVTPC